MWPVLTHSSSMTSIFLAMVAWMKNDNLMHLWSFISAYQLMMECFRQVLILPGDLESYLLLKFLSKITENIWKYIHWEFWYECKFKTTLWLTISIPRLRVFLHIFCEKSELSGLSEMISKNQNSPEFSALFVSHWLFYLPLTSMHHCLQNIQAAKSTFGNLA